MKEIVKWVKIRGQYGTFRHRALIDTGSHDTLVPRWIALQAGTWHGGKVLDERNDEGLVLYPNHACPYHLKRQSQE